MKPRGGHNAPFSHLIDFAERVGLNFPFNLSKIGSYGPKPKASFALCVLVSKSYNQALGFLHVGN